MLTINVCDIKRTCFEENRFGLKESEKCISSIEGVHHADSFSLKREKLGLDIKIHFTLKNITVLRAFCSILSLQSSCQSELIFIVSQLKPQISSNITELIKKHGVVQSKMAYF